MGELLQRVGVTRASALPPRQTAVPLHTRPKGHESPRVAMSSARALQPQLLVGPADDPFEREAQRTAETVTSIGASPSAFGALPIAASLTAVTQRAVGKNEPPTKKDDDEKKKVQKAPSTGGGSNTMPAGVESRINTMQTGGEPLSASLRASFEPRFGYDFGAVRTHSGGDAAGAAAAIGARAFTVGDHIFFGPGEFRPESASGRRLIAHELTHTVQQQSGAARATRIQRDLADIWNVVSDPKAAALALVTKWADELPPYELLTVLLGRNPITDKPVERSARNLLHAVLKLVPDGMAIFEDLEKNKTLEKIMAWFNAEVAKLDLTWEGIKGLFKSAWDAISLSDFVPPTKAWEKVKKIFGPPLGRIANFALAVGSKIFEFVKKVALDKIGAWAKQQKGYTLLTFILGKDPVTQEEVKRTPKGFVFAVLDLVPGGDKIKENLEKSKTIERTLAWLDAEIAKLDLTWEMIKGLFTKAWDAFKITDLLNPIGLLIKMGEIFGAPLGRLLRFLGAVAKKVLEFIFEGAMMIAGPIGEQIVRIVHKIGDTFTKIVEDPVAFLGHLIDAVKLGFQQFGKNIWEHLKTGLIGWLVGALEGAGIVLPKVWDLKGIVDLVLQILGITYAKMRAKLVKVIGEERVAMLERVFQFIKTLVTEGPAAAWQQIVEAIGSLWDMVIGGIKDWAISKIVTAAITKLATMFNPVGAIIQSIIAIYNTVAFFIERIKQILALVESIVDSIANIAAGKIAAAANYVEQAMARTIPVILGFLARLIGLGDVSGAIKKVITAIQEKVDKAIDAVIAWLVDKAKGLFGKGEAKGDPKWDAAVSGVNADADAVPEAEKNVEGFTKRLPGWKSKYQFTELTVEHLEGQLVIEGAMSPKKKIKTVKESEAIVKELTGEKWIQVKRGGGWLVGTLDAVDKDKAEIRYTVVFPAAGTVKAMAKFSEYDKVVRKYMPGTEPYLNPEALAAANATNEWGTNFALAKKVLNYRANEDNDQSRNPAGKDWHHIHEQSGDGPSSVKNLGLTSKSNNAQFNKWFGQLQPAMTVSSYDVGYLEGTGAKPLREYLKAKGDPRLWLKWGYACLVRHNLSVEPGKPDAKGLWNQIPGEHS